MSDKIVMNKDNFIKETWYYDSKNRRSKRYVYKCNDCDNEVHVRKCELDKRKGDCSSCSARKSIKKNSLHCRLRPYEAKFNIFKTKCPETDLVYEDYLLFVGKSCTYCDVSLDWQPHGENNPGFWLDRMDGTLGHVKGNLTVCCGLCNHTKRSVFTYQEFLEIGKIIKNIRHNRKLPMNGTGC